MRHKPRQPWDPELMDKAIRLRREEGATIREIATEIRVPRGTVGDWLRGVQAEYVERCAVCGKEKVRDTQPGRRRRLYCSKRHRRWAIDAGVTAPAQRRRRETQR